MSTDRYKRIDKIAGDWLARRDAGRWSNEDQRALEQWLNESPLHRVAFLRIEHAWERSERLRALGAGVTPGMIPPPHRWNLSPFFDREGRPGAGYARTTNRRFALATAAALLGVALFAVAWFLWPPGTSYRTPIGGLASVPMADGSKVTLNTDSEIGVTMTDKERRIELRHGEAYFEVAKDPSRPFIVHAGNKRVIAVGTRFSVKRESTDIRVVVTEGRVRVETDGNSPMGSAEPLAAGTVAQASDAGVLLQTKPLSEAEESLSWRQGILVFREMTLADASAEFNRYNKRRIVIEDPAIASLRVAGSFRANNVEAFVRLLERGYPLRVEEQDDGFVLIGK